MATRWGACCKKSATVQVRVTAPVWSPRGPRQLCLRHHGTGGFASNTQLVGLRCHQQAGQRLDLGGLVPSVPDCQCQCQWFFKHAQLLVHAYLGNYAHHHFASTVLRHPGPPFPHHFICSACIGPGGGVSAAPGSWPLCPSAWPSHSLRTCTTDFICTYVVVSMSLRFRLCNHAFQGTGQ